MSTNVLTPAAVTASPVEKISIAPKAKAISTPKAMALVKQAKDLVSRANAKEQAAVEALEVVTVAVTPSPASFARMLAKGRNIAKTPMLEKIPALSSIAKDCGLSINKGEKLTLADAQRAEWKPIENDMRKAHSAWARANRSRLVAGFQRLARNSECILSGAIKKDDKGKLVSVRLAAKA